MPKWREILAGAQFISHAVSLSNEQVDDMEVTMIDHFGTSAAFGRPISPLKKTPVAHIAAKAVRGGGTG